MTKAAHVALRNCGFKTVRESFGILYLLFPLNLLKRR